MKSRNKSLVHLNRKLVPSMGDFVIVLRFGSGCRHCHVALFVASAFSFSRSLQFRSIDFFNRLNNCLLLKHLLLGGTSRGPASDFFNRPHPRHHLDYRGTYIQKQSLIQIYHTHPPPMLSALCSVVRGCQCHNHTFLCSSPRAYTPPLSQNIRI